MCPIPISQQSSTGANNLTPITREPPPIDAYDCSRSKSTSSNPGVSQSLILMSASGVTSHHKKSTSRAFATFDAYVDMTFVACTLSGSVVPTGLPTVSSSYSGSNGVCHFYTDKFHISKDGSLFSMFVNRREVR